MIPHTFGFELWCESQGRIGLRQSAKFHLDTYTRRYCSTFVFDLGDSACTQTAAISHTYEVWQGQYSYLKPNHQAFINLLGFSKTFL